MLTLSRKAQEAILIGDNIRIVVKWLDGETVKIGIEAPRDVPIYREEVFSKVTQQNREALAKAQPESGPGAETQLKWPTPAKPASAPSKAPNPVPEK